MINNRTIRIYNFQQANFYLSKNALPTKVDYNRENKMTYLEFKYEDINSLYTEWLNRRNNI